VTQTGRRSVLLAGVAWLAVVGWLTLRSNPLPREFVTVPSWHCVLCGDGGATDFVLNLLLFAPFGLIARLARWPLGRLAAGAFALTLAIEVYQGTVLIGRDATLGDVVANTSGAMMGWWLVAWFGSFRTAPRRAAATGMVILSGQCLVWLGTSAGMRPVLSRPAPWIGRVGPAGRSSEPFEGTIEGVVLDGIEMTMAPVSRLPTSGDSLDLAIALTRTTTGTPARAASIVRLFDARSHVFLRASQIGSGINVELPLAANAWRLRTPDWRFARALDTPVGTPWQFEWRRHDKAFEMTSAPVGGPQPAIHQAISVSIGLGWVWFHPFVSAIGDSAPWWTALWIATWFALLGWTGKWVGRRFSAMMLAAGIAVFIGAGVIASLPVSAGELSAALAGYGLGWLLARSRPAPNV
jgi:hypothetical protein